MSTLADLPSIKLDSYEAIISFTLTDGLDFFLGICLIFSKSNFEIIFNSSRTAALDSLYFLLCLQLLY